MATDNIRVLIVDDSAVVRAMIGDQVTAAAGMSVAGIARNGQEALDVSARLHPDVITLDLQMPDMDGMAILDTLLARRPLPIIMVSGLTRAGAAVTLEALDRGAVDYVAKPEQGVHAISAFQSDLIAKIRSAAGMDMQRVMAARSKQTRRPSETARRVPLTKPVPETSVSQLAGRCVALGISTGGPPALTRLLSIVRPPMPPMVIVQHMPPQFTGPLACRLNSLSELSVREAVHGDLLEANCVLIAPGGKHVEFRGRAAQVRVVVRDGPTVSGHRPSVDVMMTSAAKIFGTNCLGVIMTGMGRDGAAGCQAIREAGGYVLGQDEASSDVYGMNRVAFLEGYVDQQFGLPEAASVISRQARRGTRLAPSAVEKTRSRARNDVWESTQDDRVHSE
jgi:two-component system chemotaxis response regulator CheB